MIGKVFKNPRPESFAEVARNIHDQNDVRALKREVREGTHLVMRYVRIMPSFNTDQESSQEANEYIHWLGWNSLAWHLRDFNVDDLQMQLPPSAPIAGFWDDEPLCDSLVANHVCPMVVFLSNEILLERFKQWIDLNKFVPNRAAPKPDHHINTFDPSTSELAEEHAKSLRFPDVVFIQENDNLGEKTRRKITTSNPPVTIKSLAKEVSPGNCVPQHVIEILEDDTFAAGRYALLANHGAFEGLAVETLSATVEGVQHAVRRATFCVGAAGPNELQCVTAWVFEHPGNADEFDSDMEPPPSDGVFGIARRWWFNSQPAGEFAA